MWVDNNKEMVVADGGEKSEQITCWMEIEVVRSERRGEVHGRLYETPVRPPLLWVGAQQMLFV